MFFKKIYNLGDRLEDKARGRLSHYPIIYAFIGGTGIILFWRGVWHTMDYIMKLLFEAGDSVTSTSLLESPWWDGPLSMLIGAALLLTVGLFVSSFIGNEIIISGLKREKKIVEKTEEEVKNEIRENDEIKHEIHEIDNKLKQIEKDLKK